MLGVDVVAFRVEHVVRPVESILSRPITTSIITDFGSFSLGGAWKLDALAEITIRPASRK